MSGLILQLSRAGFLLLLWAFIWIALRTVVRDARVASGVRTGPKPSRAEKKAGAQARGHVAQTLVVTHGPLANTRIGLTQQPVLIGRADDSTLVLTDDYASTRHAKLSRRGDDWYLEDLGSTNGTYLDRAKVTTPVKVPLYAPVRVGKTVIELRP